MNALPGQIDIEDVTGVPMDIQARQEQVVDLFSYAALSREDEVAAREDAALIKSNMRKAAEAVIEVGLALKRQKERLPHGMFLPWISSEFEMSGRSARRFMDRAETWGSKLATVANLRDQTPKMIDEFFASDTPQEVRDHVEALLVDGEKVTAADIKRLKAEAKAAADTTEVLTERNATLAQSLKAAAEPEVVEKAAEEAAAKIIDTVKGDYQSRINDLIEQNRDLERQLKKVKTETVSDSSVAQADESNVVRPVFNTPEPDPDEMPEFTPEGAADVYAGSIGNMAGLAVDPAVFWKVQGKKTQHGKMVYKALLEVNATFGRLIQEYSK